MFPVEPISAKMLDYYVDRYDALIIDLRDPASYRISHIRNARNIPYESLETQKQEFPEDKILIFYCEHGGTSMKAAKQIARRGHETRSVIGGFLAYRGRNLVFSENT